MNADHVDCGFRRVSVRVLLAVFFTCPVPCLAAEYRLFWGDVHGHSAISDGKGSPADYFTYARDVAKLDFVILTDHDFGNGRPEWRMPKENWTLIQEKADEFTSNGRFVAIAGYEWTSQAKYWSGYGKGSERLFEGPPKLYNHKNVYFPRRVDYLFSAKDPAHHTPDLLAEAVRRHGGLIQNNHPFVFGDSETRDQWEYAPRNRDVIVNTEMGLDTSRYKGKTYRLNWEQTVREFLGKGDKTGFVAGTDTHEGKPAARTAVLAKELTRDAIFDALRHRRNYAVNHARIGLDFRINGRFMGEEFELTGKPRMVVDVRGTAPLEEIILVRNGEVLHRLRPETQNASFTYVDETLAAPSYYYVRVIQTDTDAHGNHSHAWSSPIWVKPHSATTEAAKRSATNRVAESLGGYITSIPPESPEDRVARHKKIAERRSGTIVIAHRGAWASAPENTLEAYAAAMDYGADGCEIDIRRAADGVLVMLHDDGLDRMTDALGRVNQYTYAELLGLKFRSVYRAKPQTCIPTLAAVLELARQRAMLLHLDVKEPGLEDDIARLLDAADVWDHVVQINQWNATALRQNPKAHCLAYKAFGWQEARMDMNPEKVREGQAKPGSMIMVDDPRVAARELKRRASHRPLPDNLRASLPSELSPPRSQSDRTSFSPAAALRSLADRVDSRSLDELGKLVAADPSERTDLEGDAAHQQERACRILQRAWAAQKIGQLGDRSARAVELLEGLVAHRSLHRDWAYQGLDGAMAARALGAMGATESVPFLVRTFRAVDPDLKKMAKPPANYPLAWADYRLKLEIISVLGELPCEESRTFLREYLAMDEATAGEFAGPFFEEAARALLRQDVTAGELQGLLRSKNPAVRGATILACLDDRRTGRASSLAGILPWTQGLPRAGE